MSAQEQLAELQRYLYTKVLKSEKENEGLFEMSGLYDYMNHTILVNTQRKRGIMVKFEDGQLFAKEMANGIMLGSCPLFDWSLLESTAKDIRAVGDAIFEFLKAMDSHT